MEIRTNVIDYSGDPDFIKAKNTVINHLKPVKKLD